jgi:hypothetical protein
MSYASNRNIYKKVSVFPHPKITNRVNYLKYVSENRPMSSINPGRDHMNNSIGSANRPGTRIKTGSYFMDFQSVNADDLVVN